jgi:hypothetical protein
MEKQQNTQAAELESSVERLYRREKRLRRVLSSALTSREHRHDARDELESVLEEADATENKLLDLSLLKRKGQ